MRDLWQYRTIQVKPYMHEGDMAKRDSDFDALGAEGWELVGFASMAHVVFKRRL